MDIALLLELDGRELPEAAVAPAAVVEDLELFEDLGAQFGLGRP
jgi:hypothetical protein